MRGHRGRPETDSHLGKLRRICHPAHLRELRPVLLDTLPDMQGKRHVCLTQQAVRIVGQRMRRDAQLRHLRLRLLMRRERAVRGEQLHDLHYPNHLSDR